MADFPVPTGGSERPLINLRAHEPDVNDLRGRIESIIPYFCTNPSCIHANCPLHRKGLSGLRLVSVSLTMLVYEIFSKRLSFPSCCRPTSYEQRLSRRRVLRKFMLSSN